MIPVTTIASGISQSSIRIGAPSGDRNSGPSAERSRSRRVAGIPYRLPVSSTWNTPVHDRRRAAATRGAGSNRRRRARNIDINAPIEVPIMPSGTRPLRSSTSYTPGYT